jgi:hypothetical protein
MASVAQTHAEVVYSDDFATNPFASRWSETKTGDYPLLWTGNSNPNGFGGPSASLPVNANAHSVYSFSNGARTMSTTDTSVPVASADWNTMTYSVDFQMGGTGGTADNVIELLVNRSGNNGYTAGIYTGGSGHIAWAGDYPLTFTNPNVNVAADTWYRFKTTVTKSGADISMQSQILDLSNNVLATSPVQTFTSAAYTEPNGFQIKSSTGGYWDHAIQIDNFKVDAQKIVASDDFATNPFTSAWTQTFPGGSYDLQWTGNANPSTFNPPGLPANANAHSVYSFSTGTRTMSTVDTSVPAGVADWGTMTYSLDFQMGGTGGTADNVIELLVNRSGDNGYKAAIYTGGGGHIAWYGDYPLTFTSPNVNVAANTWYKFKTTVTKSGADISMQSQILDLSGNILATSPVKTFLSAIYTDPNGFKISLANDGGYWDHASQIDNFVVTAALPESITNDGFATNPFASRWTKTTPEGSYEVVWTGNTTPNPTWATTLPVNANDNSVYSGARGANSMSSVDTSVPTELVGWTAMDYSVDFRMDGVGTMNAPDNNAITVLVNRSGNNGYETGIFTGGDGDVAWIHNGVTQDFVENNPLQAGTWYRYTATVAKSGTTLAIRSKVLDANDNVLMTSPWYFEAGASYLNPNGFKISFGGIDYWSRAIQINKFSATLSNEAFPGYDTWATTNAGGQTTDLDYDNDGVANGVEYFMNTTPGFTANPSFVGNTVSWPNGGNIPSSEYGTQFVVQTSSDLVTWDDVTEGDMDQNGTNTASSLSYTLDPANNPAKQFVRLKVTPY